MGFKLYTLILKSFTVAGVCVRVARLQVEPDWGCALFLLAPPCSSSSLACSEYKYLWDGVTLQAAETHPSLQTSILSCHAEDYQAAIRAPHTLSSSYTGSISNRPHFYMCLRTKGKQLVLPRTVFLIRVVCARVCVCVCVHKSSPPCSPLCHFVAHVFKTDTVIRLCLPGITAGLFMNGAE